ncbi:MAG: hypothetical protein Kow00121_32740 [Elainellaceae cyanobacterium]
MIGQLLSDRYKIVHVLGAGGMGQTYVAEDTQRPGNPKCVVKQLKPASNDPNFLTVARRLFVGEAEILEKLGKHDQIPQLLAYFERDQEFYLVQEFIVGHPLSVELPLGQRWAEPEVIQLLQDLLSILEFVHRQNVIHRDIKPGNIIRRVEDNRLVLIDFGAVKQVRVQQATEVGQISVTVAIGTPGYMPTEQASGKPRPSSDIYAVGIIGIQALTGLLPTQLREDADGEIIWRDQAEVGDDLAAVLTTMTRHYFKQRYQTATEALQAVRQLTTSAPTAAPDPIGYTPTQPAIVSSPPASPSFKPAGYSPTGYVEPTMPPSTAVSATAESMTMNVAPSQIASPPPSPSPPTVTSLQKRRIWLGGGLAVAGLLAGGVSYMSYAQAQSKQHQAILQQVQSLKEEQQYTQCIEQAQTFTAANSSVHSTIQALLAECQLANAQQLASSGKLRDAILMAGAIAPETAVYDQARSLAGEWSERILELAKQQYEQGKLNEAINLAKAIPESSPSYQTAQETTETWQTEWKTNEQQFETAQNSLTNGDWQAAIEAANKVTTPYWKDKAASVIQQANSEIAASRYVPPPEPSYTAPSYTAPSYTAPSSYTAPDPVYSAPPSYTSPPPIVDAPPEEAPVYDLYDE